MEDINTFRFIIFDFLLLAFSFIIGAYIIQFAFILHTTTLKKKQRQAIKTLIGGFVFFGFFLYVGLFSPYITGTNLFERYDLYRFISIPMLIISITEIYFAREIPAAIALIREKGGIWKWTFSQLPTYEGLLVMGAVGAFFSFIWLIFV